MSISATDRTGMGETQPIPEDNSSTPLQNVKLPQELVTDSTIISLTSVATYSDKKNYEGEAGQPKLPIPVEGKNQVPLESAAQNIVTGFISKQITMLLADVSSPSDRTDLFNNLTQGTPLQNPKLSQQANQIKAVIEERVQQEAKLENFTLSALYQPKKEAWIPTPVKAYTDLEREEIHTDFQKSRFIAFQEFAKANTDLGKEAIALLKIAIEGGKVHPSIQPAFAQINTQTIQTIQEKYGLPISWVPGTTEVDKWKPVNTGIVNPKSVGEARQAMISKNTETVASNYLDVIIDSLYAQRDVLNKELLMHSEQALTNMNFKRSDQDQRNELAATKTEELLKSQQRAERFGIVSKTLMAIGAAISVLSMVLTVASAGLLSPLAIAAVAVTSAMLVYTAVDSITGVTAKTFEKLNEVFDDMTAGLSDAGAAAVKLIAVVGVVAVIAILVVLSAPSGGSAGINAATQVLAQGARMAVRQIAVQASFIILMGSGVLLEFPSEILKATGMDNTTQQVMLMLVFLLEVAAVMVVAAKATSSVTESANVPVPTNKPSVLTQEFTHPQLKAMAAYLEKMFPPEVLLLLDRGMRLFNVGMSVSTNVVEMVFQSLIFKITKDLALTEEAEAQLKALISSLDSAIQQLQSQATNAADMSSSFAQAITKILNTISASSNKLFNSLQG